MADSGGVSPGGPRISTAKRKRLAALEQHARSAAASSGAGLGRASSIGSLRQSSQRGGSEGAGEGSGRRRSGGGGGGGGRAASSADSDTQQQQQQQWEPPEPLYRRLDAAIAAGPAAEALQLPRPEANTQVVTALLEQLMATNPRAFDARAAIGLKVSDRTVMLDNPVGLKAGPAKKAGPSGRWASQLASKAAQRRLGLYQLRTAGLTYEAVQPLHASWQQYMRDVLASCGGPGAADVEARLYAADLHGCLIRVAQTADRRYQGLRGIVVRDTANTLQLVTADNRFVVVPKQLCTWEFDADRRRVVTLLGPGLAQRGTGIAGGGAKPKTLREAIRGQQRG